VIAATGIGPVIGASFLLVWRPGWPRVAVAVLMAAMAWLGTDLGAQWNRGMLQPPMRFERWSEVVRRINAASAEHELPIIVVPNLIEDSRMIELKTTSLETYFWAPLTVVNRIRGQPELLALSAWTSNRFGEATLASIEQSGGAWLVVRGGRSPNVGQASSLAELIVADLQDHAARRGADVVVESLGPANSDVQLFRARWTRRSELSLPN
jgi:hypothetical protein